MCVIIIKHAGKNMPSRSDLYAAYRRNHDGCGFASETSHYKSLNFEDFYNHLKNVPKEENCIIHFRLATHGSVRKENCHPFHDRQTDTWFMHNGILSVTPFKGKTDSETAFRTLLAPVIKKYGLYSRELQAAANSIIGSSKFAFLQNGNIKLFGKFYEYKGCYYSNLYHIDYFGYDFLSGYSRFKGFRMKASAS